MEHVFNGKKYTIQKVSPKELTGKHLELKDDERCLGYCSHPDSKTRYVKVDKTLKGKQALEIMLHELLHCANFSIQECTVDRMGREISDALWKMGYRKVK